MYGQSKCRPLSGHLLYYQDDTPSNMKTKPPLILHHTIKSFTKIWGNPSFSLVFKITTLPLTLGTSKTYKIRNLLKLVSSLSQTEWRETESTSLVRSTPHRLTPRPSSFRTLPGVVTTADVIESSQSLQYTSQNKDLQTTSTRGLS